MRTRSFSPGSLRSFSVLVAGVMAAAWLVARPGPLSAQAAGDTTAAAPSSGDTVAVAGAVLTTGIQDHMPVDTLSSFPSDVGRVYLWTRITGASDSSIVAHVWYRGDTEEARVQLPVLSPDWRTYSTKLIDPSWTGPWHVDVVNANGEVLRTVSFEVVKAAVDTTGGR